MVLTLVSCGPQSGEEGEVGEIQAPQAPQAPTPQPPQTPQSPQTPQAPKQETTTTSQAAVSSCDTTTVSTQANFVCAAPGYEEGCTCFVCGRPAACAVVDATDAVTPKLNILAPQIACTGNVEYRCGGSVPKLLAQGMRVISDPMTPKPCVGEACTPPPQIVIGCRDDFDCPDIQQCEESRCVTPQIDPPAPILTGCQDDIDCGGHKICNAQASCIVPPPPLTLEASLTSKLDPKNLGAVQIAWNIQKGEKAIEDAYLYGHFNRLGADLLDPENKGMTKCGLSVSDGRYLVTNPDGSRMTADSVNVDKSRYGYYLTGEVCDAGTCSQYEDFKKLTRADASKAPICKIDLKPLLKDNRYGQVIYTKMRTSVAGYVLYAKEEGSPAVIRGLLMDEKAVLRAPAPFAQYSFTPRLDTHKIHVSVALSKAVSFSMSAYCTGSYTLNSEGGGQYEGDCDLWQKLDGKDLCGSMKGIDGGNVDQCAKVDLTIPSASLKRGTMKCDASDLYNAANEDDCRGTLNLHWSVKRNLIMTYDDGRKETFSIPWVGAVWIIKHSDFATFGQSFDAAVKKAGYVPLFKQILNTDKDTGGVYAAKRDHENNDWVIGVQDFDGTGLGTADANTRVAYSYQSSFGAWQSGPMWMDGGILHAKINWNGRHLKSLSYECYTNIWALAPGGLLSTLTTLTPSSVNPAAPPVTLAGDYRLLIHTIEISSVNKIDQQQVTCFFFATRFDGTFIEGPVGEEPVLYTPAIKAPTNKRWETLPGSATVTTEPKDIKGNYNYRDIHTSKNIQMLYQK